MFGLFKKKNNNNIYEIEIDSEWRKDIDKQFIELEKYLKITFDEVSVKGKLDEEKFKKISVEIGEIPTYIMSKLGDVSSKIGGDQAKYILLKAQKILLLYTELFEDEYSSGPFGTTVTLYCITMLRMSKNGWINTFAVPEEKKKIQTYFKDFL